MDLKNPPKKRTIAYNINYTLRIDRELRDTLRKLGEQYDIDVPEWLRGILRNAVEQQRLSLSARDS